MSRTKCGNWSGWSNRVEIEEPPPMPPTGLSLSVSSDDLTLAYSRSESPHLYQFELHRATSQHGNYTLVSGATQNVSTSPANFHDQARGYWYRTRGRNCQTSNRTGCGEWSGWSNRVEIEGPPMPPTGLTLSVSGDDLTLTYSKSESPHRYQFELHRASSRYGTYSLVTTVNNSTSPANFHDQARRYWYKARGRNCQTSNRTGCGNWSPFTNPKVIPPPSTCTVTSLGTISGTATRNGSWSSDCESVNRPNKYARFYNFSVSQTTYVRIDLSSSVDTFIYLLNGSGTSGSVVADDDDGGIDYNSRIEEPELSDGTYTVEATTYAKNMTGSFTLSIWVEPLTPDPPTNLRVSVEAGDNDLDVTFIRSGPPHRYQIELHRATSQNGNYTLVSGATQNVSSSPADFDDQANGSWYKSRGRNCATPGRTGCGVWSDWSAAIFLNTPPTFGVLSYEFSIEENADIGDQVDVVSATDPDSGDTVTYSITAGNGAGRFAIDTDTGSITVAGELDRETIPSYSLTVEASDTNGGADTSIVKIRVTNREGYPTFLDDISGQRYNVGKQVTVSLPAATGGDGELTYTVSPPIANGLSFNPLNHTIEGTPASAANTVIYTYTAMDEDGETDQITFTVTVFDVAVMVGDERFEEIVDWMVLQHALATIQVSIYRPDGYQFRVAIPAGMGFQLNSKTCIWPVAAPTSTSKQWSRWFGQGEGSFEMVRCGIGSGNARLEVWVKLEERGTPYKLYDTEVIPQSWHRDDHVVTYYINGSGSNPNATRAIGVETGAGEGMFPNDGKPSKNYVPSEALLLLAHYEAASGAWNAVGAGVTLNRVYSDAGSDVLISGYWDTDPGGKTYMHEGELKTRKIEPYNDGVCDDSIACVKTTGTYPHIGDSQQLWIEDPPHWGHDEKARMWTTNFTEWQRDRTKFQYLPALLMHEFGHTFGLDDNVGRDIMSSAVRELEPCSPSNTIPHRCGFSDNDKNGAKAIYEHHTAH